MKNVPCFASEIKNGKFKLERKDLFEMYVASLPDGNARLTLTRKHKKRSNNQNAYYWGVVIPILSNEIGYEADEMHSAMQWKFLQVHSDLPLPTVRSTASLSTVEFEDYLVKIRTWADTELNIMIPLPNETTNEYGELT